MIKKDSELPRCGRGRRVSRRLSREQRRQRILKSAEVRFAATGFGATTTRTLAKAAGVSEAMLAVHFGTKQKLFEEVVRQNAQLRVAALGERLFSIPDVPALDCIASMAESTVLTCVEAAGNASVMAWALMELPEFAADVYRTEIGAIEALWDSEIGSRVTDPQLRASLAVYVLPYAVHACMSFGLWLAMLHHQPATAKAHARQYSEGIANMVRAVLNQAPDALGIAACIPVGGGSG